MIKYAEAMKLAAKDYLINLLQAVHGNRSRAAQIAGLHRTHLLKLLSSHELSALVESDPTQWRNVTRAAQSQSVSPIGGKRKRNSSSEHSDQRDSDQHETAISQTANASAQHADQHASAAASAEHADQTERAINW